MNLNPMFITPPSAEEEYAAFDLAYLLEGEFTSYFKGKTLPEKESGKSDAEENDSVPEEKADKALEGLAASNTFLETSRPAKLFVLSCSQMLQDNMLDPQGRSTNATFLLNIIDHLNGDDKVAQLRSKQQTLNPVAETTPTEKTLIKAFNIAVLPVLVILFGFGVLAKRTARKKKIANRFNS